MRENFNVLLLFRVVFSTGFHHPLKTLYPVSEYISQGFLIDPIEKSLIRERADCDRWLYFLWKNL
jgi:hypothetical protein